MARVVGKHKFQIGSFGFKIHFCQSWLCDLAYYLTAVFHYFHYLKKQNGKTRVGCFSWSIEGGRVMHSAGASIE